MNYILYHKDINCLDQYINQINDIVEKNGATSKYLKSLEMMTIYNLSDEGYQELKLLDCNIIIVKDFPMKLTI